ncbi:MAG: hypothetical protein PUB54_02095 [Lachnospiraceae bacterium]|nr:hypothetical protein [Lachnospiraceae bacterium]
MMNFFNKFKWNNKGSTMVEVLVGFTILVLVVVECMVHIVGMSNEMVKNSKDLVNDIHTLNEQMYTKDVLSTNNTDFTEGYTKLDGVTITLNVKEDKNRNIKASSLIMKNAVIDCYECVEADLKQLRFRYEE